MFKNIDIIIILILYSDTKYEIIALVCGNQQSDSCDRAGPGRIRGNNKGVGPF